VNHNQDWHTVRTGCSRMVQGGAERLCVNDYSLSHDSFPHVHLPYLHAHIAAGSFAYPILHAHECSFCLCKRFRSRYNSYSVCSLAGTFYPYAVQRTHSSGVFGIYTVICDCCATTVIHKMLTLNRCCFSAVTASVQWLWAYATTYGKTD
jgi:hypothetical protein